MNTEEARALVTRLLGDIAPEADLSSLDAKAEMQMALDLDSLDMLNFISELSAAIGIDIPESDYGKIASLEGCLEYVTAAAPVA